MTSRTLPLTDPLYDYLLKVSLREPPLLARLREETEALPLAAMQISPEQGQFMALLVELIGARRTLEVGTFTGYSALCVARALPADGRIVACDVSAEYTDVTCAWHRRSTRSTRCSTKARRAPSISPSSMPTRKTTTAITKGASCCSGQAGSSRSTTSCGTVP
jgi:hypothetical protein